MRALINSAILSGSEIIEQYKKLAELEKEGKKDSLATANFELQKLLKLETDLYKLFNVTKLDASLKYIRQNYPDLFLNPTKVISNNVSFSPIYRVYSHLNSIQKIHNFYNEMHTKDFDDNLAYDYLFHECIMDTIFNFFKKAKGIKNNPYFIETKYNLIASYLPAENRFWYPKKYSFVFPLNRYLKFLNLDSSEFVQRMDEQLDSYICDLVDFLTQEQKEQYYESEEFYHKLPLLEFEFRIFYFLLKDSHIKMGWRESLDSIESLTDYYLVSYLLKNISTGILFDEEMKLQLQNKL